MEWLKATIKRLERKCARGADGRDTTSTREGEVCIGRNDSVLLKRFNDVFDVCESGLQSGFQLRTRQILSLSEKRRCR